jgi:hypothetical protein
MTSRPSQQTPDQWSRTGTVPTRTPSDAPTMAAYIPPTVVSRAAADLNPVARTAARQPYMPDLAWSTERPEFASPVLIEQPRPWFMRSGVLALVGAGLVAAAAAGLVATLHGAQSTTVNTSSLGGPAPAATPANPASTPGNQPKQPTTSHPVRPSQGSDGSASQQSPSRHSSSSSSGQDTNDQQWQSHQDSISTPPTWNRNDHYWFTHRRDDDSSRWNPRHDSDERSRSDHGHSSQSLQGQSSDNHSTDSNDSGSSK